MNTQMTRQQLFSFLDSDDNQFGLDSTATHGFLTATVVGKPLDTWLSVLFDRQEDTVDHEIKEALIEWQLELLMQLKNEEPINLPFDADEEKVDFSPESELAAWAIGFVDAMYGDEANDWFDDEDTEDDVAMLILPMMVLSGVDEDDETLSDLRSDEDMLVQMINSIEKNLTELFLLFHTED